MRTLPTKSDTAGLVVQQSNEQTRRTNTAGLLTEELANKTELLEAGVEVGGLDSGKEEQTEVDRLDSRRGSLELG